MGLEEIGVSAAVVVAVATIVGTAVAALTYFRGDKSPKVEDNSQSQTLTAGDDSQNYQAGRDLIVQAPVAGTSPPASSITIKLVEEGHGSLGWEYHLEISFKNLSKRTLGEYRFEIEVPRFLLTPGTEYTGEVKERGTDLRAFIRRDEASQLEPLVCPGDSRRVWKITVYKDKPIEPTESEASQAITVTLYVDDRQAAKEESQIRDLFA